MKIKLTRDKDGFLEVNFITSCGTYILERENNIEEIVKAIFKEEFKDNLWIKLKSHDSIGLVEFEWRVSMVLESSEPNSNKDNLLFHLVSIKEESLKPKGRLGRVALKIKDKDELSDILKECKQKMIEAVKYFSFKRVEAMKSWSDEIEI